jgi:hypothetical protein
MHFHCSDCSKPIGAFFNRKGDATLFICPHTGRPAHCVPDRITPRSTPPLPKWLEGDDISQRARRQRIKNED